MIDPTSAVRVLVATKPVDFRKGAEDLAALIREQIARCFLRLANLDNGACGRANRYETACGAEVKSCSRLDGLRRAG